MAHFELNGSKEPFLIIQMQRGEKIFAESDSMLAMQDGIEIRGEARGGVMSSLGRAITSGENFFQQTLIATSDSVVMLSPSLPGDIKILNLQQSKGYFLNDYAFFAAEDSVKLEVRRNQNISSAIFGGDGFFVMYAHGKGQLAINGLGSIEEIELSSDSGDLIVDNGHLLAWEEGVHHQAQMPNRNSGGGFLSRAMQSVVSGEGIVMRLSGTGKIYIASRNLNSYRKFITTVATH